LKVWTLPSGVPSPKSRCTVTVQPAANVSCVMKVTSCCPEEVYSPGLAVVVICGQQKQTSVV